jgi:hypothetical protein
MSKNPLVLSVRHHRHHRQNPLDFKSEAVLMPNQAPHSRAMLSGGIASRILIIGTKCDDSSGSRPGHVTHGVKVPIPIG